MTTPTGCWWTADNPPPPIPPPVPPPTYQVDWYGLCPHGRPTRWTSTAGANGSNPPPDPHCDCEGTP